MPELERNLRRYAGRFGETNAQAVIRWSVNTCRGLSRETQVYGAKAKETKGKQIGAIIKDALNVLVVAETVTATARGWRCTNSGGTFYASSNKFLTDTTSVNNWIEINRTKRNSRTAKLSIGNRKVCSKQVFNKAIGIRSKRAGMAKGGWLVAGDAIANSMRGGGMQKMGRNFGGYAFKAAKGMGSVRLPQPGFSPEAFITNHVSHVSSSHVLPRRSFDKELAWGLQNTISWYQTTLRKLDRR